MKFQDVKPRTQAQLDEAHRLCSKRVEYKNEEGKTVQGTVIAVFRGRCTIEEDGSITGIVFTWTRRYPEELKEIKE